MILSTRDLAFWRLGCDGRVLGAAFLRFGPALPGLAVPAIEGAGDCGRQRLERSLDRGRRRQAGRRQGSRSGGAAGRPPHPDGRREEIDRGLSGRHRCRKAAKGKDLVRLALFDAQCAARRGDERDRALFAQAEIRGRRHPRTSPEAAGHAGQGRRRSGADRGTREPTGVADAHFRGPAQIDFLCVRGAGPDREAAVRSRQRDRRTT